MGDRALVRLCEGSVWLWVFNTGTQMGQQLCRASSFPCVYLVYQGGGGGRFHSGIRSQLALRGPCWGVSLWGVIWRGGGVGGWDRATRDAFLGEGVTPI